ncbi:hypothetical protein L9F63_009478, partial [Diploptera punctata]
NTMISYGLCMLLLVSVPAQIYGFKTGAPESVCEDMEPQHHSKPQTSPSPYSIKVSQNTIKAGETVTVTLEGNENSGIQFKGFFVQARVGNTPIGKFDEGTEIKLVDCGNSKGSAASHNDNKDKSSITLKWTAPASLSEDVRFRATFVKDGATYWVGQESNTLRVK